MLFNGKQVQIDRLGSFPFSFSSIIIIIVIVVAVAVAGTIQSYRCCYTKSLLDIVRLTYCTFPSKHGSIFACFNLFDVVPILMALSSIASFMRNIGEFLHMFTLTYCSTKLRRTFFDKISKSLIYCNAVICFSIFTQIAR